MKPVWITAACVGTWLAAPSSFAACYEMKKVDGVLIDVPVSCEALDRPLPCSKETILPNGSRLIEDSKCAPGQQKTMQQVEREEAAAQKKSCGKDYQALKVGMPLERFERCTDGVAFVTETVVKGAVIETYRSTFYWIQVRNGRILAFTRR